jgi:hypothetical protein
MAEPTTRKYRAVSDYDGPHSSRKIVTGHVYDLDPEEVVVKAGVVVEVEDAPKAAKKS